MNNVMLSQVEVLDMCILIVDDYFLFCVVMCQVMVDIVGDNIIEVVLFFEVYSVIEVDDLLELVFFDLNMLGNEGFIGLIILCIQFLGVLVVIVLVEEDLVLICKVIDLGVSGYILKFILLVEIVEVVNYVFDGE